MSTELVFRCLVCDQPRTEADVPCELCGAAPDLHVVEGDELVTYDPFRLNRLVSAAAAARVAHALAVLADSHHYRARLWADRDAPRAQWHRTEAASLEWMRAAELARAELEETA
ncbi:MULTISPECIES: hypothetical protein [Amycolatopsis]|uniref:Uncharacterized protein n=1 Tax=Amycolatopsis thermalba TaxID=944492 RepID=A0ABY4NP02_9PSEU|nr:MULTISPECIES: hypothetical protein [Amycolatopsis]OXM74549.1 hypothetical protein CF166_04300 [Amycolatopsis sp. KNN50.9b]UQS21763.1 hypothetical protein L1857_02445 [Amycolatopsis thermalba]